MKIQLVSVQLTVLPRVGNGEFHIVILRSCHMGGVLWHRNVSHYTNMLMKITWCSHNMFKKYVSFKNYVLVITYIIM